MSTWFGVRRHLDRLAAAIGGVVVMPLVAVLAWLVRRHDGARPIIGIERIGRSGTPFQMWKLRSMSASDPDGRAEGPSLTSAGDPRITPVGRWLRTLHLDELPQLANVVRGEMTILGPRPEAPDFVDGDDPRWQAVLVAPPGLVAPTQLVVGDWERDVVAASPDGSGYREEVLPVKLELDRWYLENASPAIDLMVVWSMVRKAVAPGLTPRLAARIGDEVPSAKPLLRGEAPPANPSGVTATISSEAL